MARIDFNCDLGEGCGDDAALVPWLTSASIACGAHAGNDATMRATLRLCHAHGVAAGAHPGYDDRAHFGRRELSMPAEELRALLDTQLQRIGAIARDEGVRLAHVKPHGALYNLAARDRAVADVVAAAVHDFDASLVLFALAGSESIRAGEAAGLRVAREAFAERAYDADGRLAPRGTPGAVIEGLDAAIAQVRRLVRGGGIVARDGTRIPLRADTLCLHGDRPDAAEFARALRTTLESEGITVEALH
ncbi:MAG TPA: 5-oxoprolinase subunit PxpA [Xanthomonadaceae bacterium]|nr:5-oxoprolinase subunit PxpA [Xanthomonadaceae bacterium]